MKYTAKPTKKFQKDLKTVRKRGYDISNLGAVVKKLANGEQLPSVLNDHPLMGVYSGCRECHIEPDRLLIYRISGTELILYLTRTDTHSDLF